MDINDESIASNVGLENEVENGRRIPIFENDGEDEPIPRGLIHCEKVGGFRSLALEIYKVVFDVHQVKDKDIISALNPLPGFYVSYSDFGGGYLGLINAMESFLGECRNDHYKVLMQEIQIEGIIEYLSLDIRSINKFVEFYRSLQLLYSAFVNTEPTKFFYSSEA